MNKIKYFKYFLPVLSLPAIILAHGLDTTQTAISGDYKIEFEYDSAGNVIAQDYTLYSFYLLNADSSEGVDFDSAFLRVQKQDGPAVLSASLAQAAERAGNSNLSAVINEPGAYIAQISFYKDGKTLAESKFDFTVEKNQREAASDAKTKGSTLLQIAFVAIGIAIGAAGSLLLRKSS